MFHEVRGMPWLEKLFFLVTSYFNFLRYLFRTTSLKRIIFFLSFLFFSTFSEGNIFHGGSIWRILPFSLTDHISLPTKCLNTQIYRLDSSRRAQATGTGCLYNPVDFSYWNTCPEFQERSFKGSTNYVPIFTSIIIIILGIISAII